MLIRTVSTLARRVGEAVTQFNPMVEFVYGETFSAMGGMMALSHHYLLFLEDFGPTSK